MAELNSPGISTTVTDESFYAPAGSGTVPLIVIATAQDKPAPDGSGTAPFTTAAEAGELKLITSQRDLLTNYGNPIFKTQGGTPLHGDERNEYGLLAAYSFLGIANRAYVLRADVDLDQLVSSTSAPVSEVADGTYWLDTTSTRWGVKVWDGTKFVLQDVLVPALTDITDTPTHATAEGNVGPKTYYGRTGDFAVVYTNEAGESLGRFLLWKKADVGGNVDWRYYGEANFDESPGNEADTHLNIPDNNGDGNVFLQTTAPNNGTSLSLKVYDEVVGQFINALPADSTEYTFPTSQGRYARWNTLNPGQNVTAGTLWFDTTEFALKIHNGQATVVAESTAAVTEGTAWSTNPSNVSLTLIINDGGNVNVNFANANTISQVASAINNALDGESDTTHFVDGVVASNVDSRLRIVSGKGYDIKIRRGDDVEPADLNLVEDIPYSNWSTLSYTPSATAPTGTVANGTLWSQTLTQDSIDILQNEAGTGWVTYDKDINFAASEPTLQSDGTSALVSGDLWIDGSELEDDAPVIRKWDGSAWVLIDNADDVSPDGIVFADFRPTNSGNVDVDAPDESLYPVGILAWNKRASGGNVKQWIEDYTVGGELVGDRWVDYSGNRADGSPYFLRKAIRRAVTRQMQAALASNEDIRNEVNRFNLVAAPGYPELLDDMISLNVDRKETAFVVGDTPMRLEPQATAIQDWATNANGALENGEDGLLSSSPYAAVYYPAGLSTNLDGTNVVVPASHIALRTIAFNDQVAFPWFAPAGFQRGLVSNATNIGYIDADTAEFRTVALSEGQRDVLYNNKVNPIGNFPGRGLAVFGQKTLNPNASALDRINVARLVVYIRDRLDFLMKPYLFQPNDEVTRQNVKVAVDRFLGQLVSQRGLFDFLTVCDTSNNTPARIDRNELWVDVAISPTKAVEFIYIPIRVQNTLGSNG